MKKASGTSAGSKASTAKTVVNTPAKTPVKTSGSKYSNEKIFNDDLDEMLRKFHLLEENHPQRTRLRDKIIEQVMPYVKKIAHGLARRSSDPVEDIVQVGNIGLMKAVEKYNPFAGTSFKTYSTYLITGEIRHYLRDKTSMIKAPRQMYELYYRMNQIIQRLSEAYGRTPTDEEIAKELECPVYKVAQVQEIERRRMPVSLDQFLVNDNGQETVYLERLVDSAYDDLAQSSEDRMTVEAAVGQLKDELQEVVRMTYFDDMSQSEIAKVLGISQMQVSRRLRKALDLLSDLLKRDAVEAKR